MDNSLKPYLVSHYRKGLLVVTSRGCLTGFALLDFCCHWEKSNFSSCPGGCYCVVADFYLAVTLFQNYPARHAELYVLISAANHQGFC